MKSTLLSLLAAVPLLLSSCQTGGAPTAGQYAMGDDARAVQEGRARTTLTESELQQHRRQRTDVSEEMDLDEKKRRARMAPLRTAAEATGLVRSIIGGGILRY